MIHIIEGRSGSGKTAYLYDKLAVLAKKGHKKLVYLMPEQSSFECEKDFLHILGAPLVGSVRVMSFTRLYNMVMSETGGMPGTPIDDGMRKMIMSFTLSDCADSLDLYAKQAAKPQFIDVALNAIKEFKQCGVTPKTVRDTAATAAAGDLGKKLSELSMIYELYNANVENSGADPYDNDMRLEKRIAETDFFAGYTIAVDDFSGFTAQQHKILELMMRQASDFYISLCTEPRKYDDLFFTVDRTKKRILRSAKELSLELAPIIRLEKNLRTNDPALLCFEENLYRSHKAELPEGLTYDNIYAVQAADVYDECEYVAAEIKELALSQKCRYRDIAVVFRNVDKYDGVLDYIFKKSGIPCFMSKPQPIDSKPLMRLAVSALEYMISPNDESKLINAVKSGMLGVSPYRIACLENYIFVWGIRGKQFIEEFTLNPQGYAEEFTDFDKKNLESINKTRKRIIEPFEKMRSELESTTGLYTCRQISTALYNYMVNAKVPLFIRDRAEEKLKLSNEEDSLPQSERDEAEEKLKFSDEEVRLWDMFTDILNKMHTASGERQITLKRYCELFKLFIKDCDISDIPQTLDQVLIGKADSIRLAKPYAVFVLGALTGEFPHIPVADGMFSDIERQRLISLGLPLYDDLENLFKQEKFLVYNAISAPTDKLYVSYPKSDLAGKDTEPSAIISEMMRIFPELKLTYTQTRSDLDRLISDKAALELYAAGLNAPTPFHEAIKKYLDQSKEYGHRLSSLGQPIKNINLQLKGKGVPEALFGKDKFLSATQIESFYKCRFGYFCDRGLKLKDRRKAELDSLVYGTILHYIIENVLKEYINREYAPFSDEELKELIERLLKSYMNDVLGGEKDKTDRFMYIYYRSKDRVMNVISHMLSEIAQSEFKPVDLELSVGDPENGIGLFEIPVEDDRKVFIKGKIDRVDVMHSVEGDYVRVIDYKTSGKTFHLSDVMHGLNSQMLIYLMAIAENGAERYNVDLSPAAILYIKANIGGVSLQKITSEDEEELRKAAKTEMLKKLKMNGLYLGDDTVAQGMEKKKGSYITSGGAVTKRQLALIFDIVTDRIKNMSKELDSGDITAAPVYMRSDKKSACLWCAFKDVCRHENTDSMITIISEKTKDTIEKMNTDEEEESGNE